MDDKFTDDSYRQCFGSDIGRQVLANLLLEMGFFNTDITPENLVLSNFAKVILHKCGVMPKFIKNKDGTITVKNTLDFVQLLFTMPYEEQKK